MDTKNGKGDSKSSCDGEDAGIVKAFCLKTIVSGGQTGVDRAALDVAIQLGFAHGGWCPKGRLAEDGRIPNVYRLVETDSSDYSDRTKRNVIDSDATLVLHLSDLEGGTMLTARFAEKQKKPCLKIRLSRPGRMERLFDWLVAHQIQTLNVAGPRASKSPAVYQRAHEFLARALSER